MGDVDHESVVCEGLCALALQAAHDLLISNYFIADGTTELTLDDICGGIGEKLDEYTRSETEQRFVDAAIEDVCISALWKTPKVDAFYEGDELPPEDSDDDSWDEENEDEDDVECDVGVDVGKKATRRSSRRRRRPQLPPPPPGRGRAARPLTQRPTRGRWPPAPRGRGNVRVPPPRLPGPGRGVPGARRPPRGFPPRGRGPGRAAPPTTIAPQPTAPGTRFPRPPFARGQPPPLPVPVPVPYPVAPLPTYRQVPVPVPIPEPYYPEPFPVPVPAPPYAPVPTTPPMYVIPDPETGLCPEGYIPSQTHPEWCELMPMEPGFVPPTVYTPLEEPGFREALRRKVMRRISSNHPQGYRMSGAFVRSSQLMPPQINAAHLARAAHYVAAGAVQLYQQQTGQILTHEQRTALKRAAWNQAKAANRFASRGLGGHSMGSGGYATAATNQTATPETVGYYHALTIGLPDIDTAPLPATFGMDQDTVRIFLLSTMLDVSRDTSSRLFDMIRAAKTRIV